MHIYSLYSPSWRYEYRCIHTLCLQEARRSHNLLCDMEISAHNQSVYLFCTLVWMLTFEFTTPGLNVARARIFHYPHLWISEPAWVEVNIQHDLHEHYIEVHIKEARCLQYASRRGRWQEERRREMMDRYVISIFATCKHLLCAAAEVLPLNCKFLNCLIW